MGYYVPFELINLKTPLTSRRGSEGTAFIPVRVTSAFAVSGSIIKATLSSPVVAPA
jgi:hypothetical protein